MWATMPAGSSTIGFHQPTDSGLSPSPIKRTATWRRMSKRQARRSTQTSQRCASPQAGPVRRRRTQHSPQAMRSASAPAPAAHSTTIHCRAGLPGEARVDSTIESIVGAAIAPASADATAAPAVAASPAKASLAKVSTGSSTQASKAPQATA